MKPVRDRAQAAQDFFAQLVEECRIGTVYRCELSSNPDRTKYIAHKPGIDLSTLPVFYLGEMGTKLISDEIDAGIEAVHAKQLRLPYPRCGFLSYVSSNHPSLTSAQHYRLLVGRYYLMVAEELDDGILFYSFMRHENMDHWAKQIWQVVLHDGVDATMAIAFDPEATSKCSDEYFMTLFSQAIQDRVMALIPIVQQIMTRNGTVSLQSGSEITQKINARREKMHLIEVPRIRVIDLKALPTVSVSTVVSSGKGSPKRPHYRQATWRTLPSGQRVPVKSAAIHGGGGVAPPWYEVRGLN